MMKFLGHTMKKVSLESLTLKGHSETKSSREKQLITNSMCEWMAENEQRLVVKGWNLFKATKDRKLWRVIITYLLKELDTQTKDKIGL